MKGQFSIEYFGSIIFFLIAVLAVASIGAGKMPQFEGEVQEAALNVEAYELSERLLTSPGYHSYGAEGTNWEKNESTRASTEEVGLSTDYKVVSKEKMDQISTLGSDKLNYSVFEDAEDPTNNYRFRFTWKPIFTTSESFTRGSAPDYIREPLESEYQNAGNRVHYTEETFISDTYCFMVVSHNGIYDTLYKTEYNGSAQYPCDFYGEGDRYEQGEAIILDGYNFGVEKFQNREMQKGGFFMLSREIKTFGASFDRTSKVIKMDRYATLKEGESLQPLVVEVWAW